MPNGKRKSVYGATKTELKAKLQIMAENQQRGRPFAELIDEWWKYHQKEIAYNTREGYIRPIADIKKALGKMRVKEITSLDIQRFITAYARNGARARNTVKIRKSVISQDFDFGILQTQEMQINQATVVKIPKSCPTEEQKPPDDMTIEVIKKSKDKTFGLFPFLLIYTGLRPGESCLLDGKISTFPAM